MTYLVLANLYLTVLYGFYHFFLRKETFFQWNRIYLLAGLGLAFLLPLAEYNGFSSYAAAYQSYLPMAQIEEPVGVLAAAAGAAQQTASYTIWDMLYYAYIIGCIAACCLFLVNLSQTMRQLRRHAKGQAYSFFGAIRIDYTLPGSEKIQHHEYIHARQWHSLDIILMQLVKIFSWFNPIVYVYERALKLQHEYIADGKSAANEQVSYAKLLVCRAMGVDEPVLANQFAAQSLLKQRINMLLKGKSPKRMLLKFVFVLPVVAALLVCSVACNQNRGGDGAATSLFSGEETDVIAFKTALAKQVPYSTMALENGVSGDLWVAYEKDGDEIRNIEFLNVYGHGQEEEVRRVLLKEEVAQSAPAGKNVFKVKFKIVGREIQNERQAPDMVSPGKDYQQLGEFMILGYVSDEVAHSEKRASSAIEPPPPRVEQVRKPVAKPAKAAQQDESDGQPVGGLGNELFTAVEVQPQPPGGMAAFREYIAKTFNYPEGALENGVNGIVEVSFVVERDGSLTDYEIKRDLDYGTGEAAIRVLQSSSKWRPGIQNGRPVRVAYTLPIRLNSVK